MSEIVPESHGRPSSPASSGCSDSPRSGSTWLLSLLAQHPLRRADERADHRLPPEPVPHERARLSGRGPRLLQLHDPQGRRARSREVLLGRVPRRLDAGPAPAHRRPAPRLRRAVPQLASARGVDPRRQGAERLPGRGPDHGRAARGRACSSCCGTAGTSSTPSSRRSWSAAGSSGPSRTCRGSPTRSDSTSSPTPRTAGSGGPRRFRPPGKRTRAASSWSATRSSSPSPEEQPRAGLRMARARHSIRARCSSAVDKLAFERIKSTRARQVQPLRDARRLAREPPCGRAGSSSSGSSRPKLRELGYD